MRKQLGDLSALPSKRIYSSIIADYDLNRSICELLDNAIDLWILAGKRDSLKINVDINVQQQVIEVTDDAGGVRGESLSLLVAPGETSNRPEEETIGIFGVGTKRAVVALAQEFKITTRYHSERTCEVGFDDSWLETDKWDLPYYEVSDIAPGATRITMQRLRSPISNEDVAALLEHLSVTYANFLQVGSIEIWLNSIKIIPKKFEKWAYPPRFGPRRYTGTIIMPENKRIEFEVLGGLTRESSPASGEYGVYVYCNDRLIGRALKSIDVGFVRGLAGLPHPSISIMRVIVSLKGPAYLMPWNSSKSDINSKHHTFLALRDWLVQVVKEYASLARRLEGEWYHAVFPYTTGTITTQQIADVRTERRSYLPALPVAKPRYFARVTMENRSLTASKPWCVGISEAMIAVELISKQRFMQKNRIVLILLDSTLEIALKEYLVNELTGKYYSDKELLELFKNWHKVVEEIKKYKPMSEDIWKKALYYHGLRSKLIHERSVAQISDNEIDDFWTIVALVLGELFGLKFNV
jgi:hypothetical protein